MDGLGELQRTTAENEATFFLWLFVKAVVAKLNVKPRNLVRGAGNARTVKLG